MRLAILTSILYVCYSVCIAYSELKETWCKRKKAGGCPAERERTADTEREGHTNAALYQDAARAGKKEAAATPTPEERVRSPGNRGGRADGKGERGHTPRAGPNRRPQSFAYPCCLHEPPLADSRENDKKLLPSIQNNYR
jgi:hypothetical protein